MTTETVELTDVTGGDEELFKLRCRAKYLDDHLTQDQTIRLALVDGFLSTIDDILEDKALKRYRSIVLTPMWSNQP